VFWHNPGIARANIDGIERSCAIKPVIFVEKGARKSIVVNKKVHDAICTDKAIGGFVSEPIAILDVGELLSHEEIKGLKLRQIEP
jgi:hypothetical protein